MTRNLKALGLALVAVFAMSAMVVSAAQAQNGRITSTGPVTLVGKTTGEPPENSVTFFGARVECPKVVFTGHKVKSFAQTKEQKKKAYHCTNYCNPGKVISQRRRITVHVRPSASRRQ